MSTKRQSQSLMLEYVRNKLRCIISPKKLSEMTIRSEMNAMHVCQHGNADPSRAIQFSFCHCKENVKSNCAGLQLTLGVKTTISLHLDVVQTGPEGVWSELIPCSSLSLWLIPDETSQPMLPSSRYHL